MPPKKDAFADLFLSAAGASQSLSNSSLNILASQDQKPKPQATQWSNIEILSPNVASPRGSSSNTPKPSAAQFDPFSIFDSKPSPSPSVSISVNQDNAQIKPNVQSNVQSNVHPRSRPSAGVSLLDDEFTDAFVTSEPEPLKQPQSHPQTSFRPVAPTPERANIAAPIRPQSAQAMDERDTVLAELIDIGFPIGVANKAIDDVGPDLQTCVNHIMSRGQSRSSSGLLRSGRNGRNVDFNRGERQPTNSPDLGGSFQDISSDILKKASWLFDKSKKTVIKNINHLQNTHTRDANNSMPTWMKNQSKYKDGALERKSNGETYVDYGDDEENINAEEIQRIMRQQREREVERQRERLESMGKTTSGRSSRGSGKDFQGPPDVHIHAALGRNSPAVAPRVPVRPSLTPANSRSSRARQPSSPQVKSTSNVPVPTASQPPKAAAQKVPEPEFDLLGLGGGESLSRAERFKQHSGEGQTYVSPSRRRPGKASKPRNTTAEALNAFQQSDFETFKGKATTSFTQGDYGDALSAYTRCLEALPPKHELRIVIFSNLAITQINLGNYKAAKQQCEQGIELVGENIDDTDWTINDKVIKYWYIRLLTRKAESLQMLENFPESLQCYVELVTKYGVTDKKVMDAKRRVGNIVNPPKPAPKPRPKSASPTPVPSGSVANNEVVEKIRQKHQQERAQDEMRFKLHDQVHDRITAWTNGKEGNLRSLLMSLDEVIPSRLGFPFLQKKITISDLMLTKKVKINYMKVISSIHPDKLSKFGLEDQMICQAVFVALNKAWDTFKEQNGLN